jgi:Fe-S-cluster containining protein
LTHHDLHRLAEGIGSEPSSLIEWLAPDDIDMSGEPETFVELSQGRRIMILAHAAGACRLLNHEGRCSQYAARPAACAAYPFASTAESGPQQQPHQLMVLPDAPCDGVELGDADETRRAVSCVETELNDYVGIVSQWNKQQTRRKRVGRRPKSAGEFIAWLMSLPINVPPLR